MERAVVSESSDIGQRILGVYPSMWAVYDAIWRVFCHSRASALPFLIQSSSPQNTFKSISGTFLQTFGQVNICWRDKLKVNSEYVKNASPSLTLEFTESLKELKCNIRYHSCYFISHALIEYLADKPRLNKGRGGSRTPVTSTVELLIALVNGFQLLVNFAKSSTTDVVEVHGSPLLTGLMPRSVKCLLSLKHLRWCFLWLRLTFEFILYSFK